MWAQACSNYSQYGRCGLLPLSLSSSSSSSASPSPNTTPSQLISLGSISRLSSWNASDAVVTTTLNRLQAPAAQTRSPDAAPTWCDTPSLSLRTVASAPQVNKDSPLKAGPQTGANECDVLKPCVKGAGMKWSPELLGVKAAETRKFLPTK